MIKDIIKNKIIYQDSLDSNIVKKLIQSSQKINSAFYILTEKNMYKDNRNNKAQHDIDEWYINGEFYNIANNIATIDLSNFETLTEETNRILFFSMDSDSLEKINKDLLQIKNIRTKFEKTYKNYQLLLVSRIYSKAIGVKNMCNFMQIPIKDTIAFGDAENDIEMLNTVGLGIGMKNSKISLNTDKITEYTNNDDGVAKYLENMLTNGEL